MLALGARPSPLEFTVLYHKSGSSIYVFKRGVRWGTYSLPFLISFHALLQYVSKLNNNSGDLTEGT